MAFLFVLTGLGLSLPPESSRGQVGRSLMAMTGGCACGALRYRAEGEPLVQGLCHCRTCQRVSGAGHVGFMTFSESAVSVEGPTRTYSRTGGSGRTATRYACATC